MSAAVIAYGRHTFAEDPADCIVVAGSKLTRDGRVSRKLERRIETAVALYRRQRAPVIIFTGGRKPDTPISEAEAARARAARQGVPAAAMRVDTVSLTTWENFVQAREIMRQNGWRSCLVVSSPEHVLRCVWFARDLGLDARAAPCSDTGDVPFRTRVREIVHEADQLIGYGLQACISRSASVTY